MESKFQKHFIVKGQSHLMELGLIFILRDDQAALIFNTYTLRIKSAVSLLLDDESFSYLKNLQGR